MSDRVTVKVGTASVSYGPHFYGHRSRIIANAPLSLNGFDDLISALTAARIAYEREHGK